MSLAASFSLVRHEVRSPFRSGPANSRAGEGEAVHRQGLDNTRWSEHVHASIASVLRLLGTQQRNLVVQSGFSGMGTHALAWNVAPLALRITESAGADRKHAAQVFARCHGLMGTHFYEDFAALSSADGGYCVKCHQWCPVPTVRPDMFLAGFPCQPFSPMRRRGRDGFVIPSEHHGFEGTRLLIQYLRRVQPRSAVLENSLGIDHTSEIAGQQQSGLEFLQGQIQDLYFMATTVLDVCAWVSIRRPRFWIFLVHRDIGSQDVANDAALRAQAVQQQRQAAGPPTEFSRFVLTPPHPRASEHTTEPRTRASSRTWKHECDSQRRVWQGANWPWHDAHPLAKKQLLGLAGTAREREILEVRLLQRCARLGLPLHSEADLALACQGFFCDVSQNIRTVVRSVCSENSPADTQAADDGFLLPTLCTQSRVYSYAHDQLVHPADILHAFGWFAVNSSCINHAALCDLVGECQAVQCAASAQWALLLALGTRLPNLWDSHRAGQDNV